MNANYINAICRATKEILTNHFDLQVSPLPPSASMGSISSNDVAVILGVKGQLKGQIICSFSVETAKRLVGVMMGGMQINQLDEMGWSAVQEFGNWIAGTTATELSRDFCIIDVTTPIVNEGNSTFHSSNRFVTVPLDTQIGGLNVHISLKESNS